MSNLVVDTSIIINFTRGKDRLFSQLLNYAHLNNLQIFIPTVVLTEIFIGREMLIGNQEKKVLNLLKKLIRVDLSEEIALLAARLSWESNLLFDIADFIIAATSLKLKARLATANIRHFKDVPQLKLFDFRKFAIAQPSESNFN